MFDPISENSLSMNRNISAVNAPTRYRANRMRTGFEKPCFILRDARNPGEGEGEGEGPRVVESWLITIWVDKPGTGSTGTGASNPKKSKFS